MNTYTTLVDTINEHGAVWNHDISYDEPVACRCGAERDENDEFDYADHLAGVLVASGLVEIEESVRGCSCGMADYGAPGHEGHADFDGNEG